jgi:GH15 family glucan-1,4-alpha-glucosidase
LRAPGARTPIERQARGGCATPADIKDYALIGDCETTALVSKDGSIDWLCWPRFDGEACFAALLGTPDNGRWLLCPVDGDAETTRAYRKNTLVLETTHKTPDGVVSVIDFMPLRGKSSDIVRLVVGRRGQVAMRTELVLRFDYGSIVPWVKRLDKRSISAIAGPHRAILRTPVQVRGEDMKSVAEFVVSAGQTVPFVLSYSPSWVRPPVPVDPQKALRSTQKYWRNWCKKAPAVKEYGEAVTRSLITLKALTYHPTGGIVAAPTTSLPEQLGGSRNWDYRYCWLRDTTFTLQALMNSGYYEEAKAWRDWLLRALAGAPEQVQIMYGIAGDRRLTEWQVPWLAGYQGARPVRIGNAAAGQLQIDIYGELMDAVHQARSTKALASKAGWELQVALMKHLETIWDKPDEGIWETRGGRQMFTYSKVMAWVAFDRSIKSAERFGFEGPIDRWRKLRAQIHDEVCENAFNAKIGAFVDRYGGTALDASTLLIALVGFLPASDPRVRGTVEAIERNLTADGFVMRYDTRQGGDGLPVGEGAFLACSFWLADNLVLLGRHHDAKRLYERLLSLRNDVGLLAEEYDPNAKRLVGNFPQAFSHIAIINTAHNLMRKAKPAEQRCEHKALDEDDQDPAVRKASA